jgi:hypothetical protein
LISRGFTHLNDLLAFTPPASVGCSPWLTKEDAVLKTGSAALGAALYSIIDLTPHEWSKIVRRKIREPFSSGDWVIRRSEFYLSAPWFAYQVIDVQSTKLMCQSYRVLRSETHPFFLMDDMLNVVISKPRLKLVYLMQIHRMAPFKFLSIMATMQFLNCSFRDLAGKYKTKPFGFTTLLSSLLINQCCSNAYNQYLQ